MPVFEMQSGQNHGPNFRNSISSRGLIVLYINAARIPFFEILEKSLIFVILPQTQLSGLGKGSSLMKS